MMRRFLFLGALALSLAGCNGKAPEDHIPEDVVAHNIAGTSLLGQQKWTEAEARFRQGLAIRPEDPVLLNNLAVALIQQGKSAEAEEALRRGIAAAPDDAHVNYNLGLIEKDNGNFEVALGHLRKVAAEDPDDVSTQYNLGTVLSRMDRTEEAEAAFRRTLDLDPTHISALYGLGRLLLQAGRAEEGTAFVEKSQEVRATLGKVGLAEAVGTQYGEQGPYAMGLDYPAGGLGAPDPIPVRFGPAPAPLGERWATALADGAGDFDGDGSVETPNRPPAEARVALDIDHDGDLDVLACPSTHSASPCVIATNDGSGSFTERTDHGITADPSRGPVSLGFSDLDNDRDIDVIVADGNGVRWFPNRRDGSFGEVALSLGGGTVRDLEVADLNKDGFMDLVLATSDGPRVSYNRHRHFEPAQELAPGVGGPVDTIAVLDFDNDGFLDVAAGGPALFRNLGRERFALESEALAGVSAELLPVAAIDSDGDSDLDLVVRDATGVLGVLANEGGNAHRAATVSPVGVRDNRLGIGSKVEVLAGVLRQKFEVTRPIPVHAGIGTRVSPVAVRILWPGGVLQDEVDLDPASALEITQLDRKGTSCPLLYARRGGRWEFVTDFLGGCAIGYRHGRDLLNVPDTDEYVKIDGGLEEEDGTLRLRLNNQLEEVIFFDRAELLVVDHPAGTEVFPNESLMPGPPWPEFELFASSDVRPVVAAREVETDRDVTARLRAIDRTYPDGFELLRFKGYAEPHTLEIDLGPLPAGRRVVLLLDGWIDYADSSSNIAAQQAGVSLEPPRLLVADGKGGFRESGVRTGFPAGLPKTMAVDLTGALPREDHRIRIATSMRLFWDRARTLVGGEDTPLRVRRLDAVTADLRFGGFPRETSLDGKRPFAYNPDLVDGTSPFKAHVGAYTAFGEVAPLVAAVDDRFVVTRNGDEIELRFDAPAPPEAGWTRTYLLYADGFGKDMDPNSAAADAVWPMPFHGMPVYPYGDGVTPPSVDAPREVRWVAPSAEGLPGVALLVEAEP